MAVDMAVDCWKLGRQSEYSATGLALWTAGVIRSSGTFSSSNMRDEEGEEGVGVGGLCRQSFVVVEGVFVVQSKVRVKWRQLVVSSDVRGACCEVLGHLYVVFDGPQYSKKSGE